MGASDVILETATDDATAIDEAMFAAEEAAMEDASDPAMHPVYTGYATLSNVREGGHTTTDLLVDASGSYAEAVGTAFLQVREEFPESLYAIRQLHLSPITFYVSDEDYNTIFNADEGDEVTAEAEAALGLTVDESGE